MSIYTKQAKIGSCPAYDVFKREVDPQAGVINITSADILGIKVGSGARTFYRRYSPGSCASYALEYNECPIKAYQTAVERGHATHWLNQCSTALTDSIDRRREEIVEVEVGQKVLFEGRVFTLVCEFNNNIGLMAA
jgi:hypothetical protein